MTGFAVHLASLDWVGTGGTPTVMTWIVPAETAAKIRGLLGPPNVESMMSPRGASSAVALFQREGVMLTTDDDGQGGAGGTD